MQVQTLYDSHALVDYFYHLTEDAWQHIDFKPKTYFNTYVYKKDTSIENIYYGMSGKKSGVNWTERTRTYNLKNGILYYIYFDKDNAVIGEDDHLHTYVLVTNNSKCNEYYDMFKQRFSNSGDTLWFSYMKGDTGFDWHVDGNMSRYHQVLINDGITPSFSTLDNELYYPPDTAFIEDVSISHRVLPSIGERLHLIGSMSND
jgi:hypothetical protein